MRYLFPLALIATAFACAPANTCRSDDDCSDNAHCALSGGALICAPACNADVPCEAGFTCSQSGDVAICIEVSGELELGRECVSDAQCQSGACLAGTGGNRVCLATCQADGDCQGDDKCFVVQTHKICLAPLDDRDAGERCEDARECASSRCAIVPHLDADSALCVDACTGIGDCAAGEGCVSLVDGGNVCVLLTADGESCVAEDVCAGGRCIIDGAAGDSQICASACSGDCAEGFACVPDDEICLPLLDTRSSGAACQSARQCESGHCGDFSLGGDTSFGNQCADPCGSGNECPANTTCWETSFGPSLCGPIP